MTGMTGELSGDTIRAQQRQAAADAVRRDEQRQRQEEDDSTERKLNMYAKQLIQKLERSRGHISSSAKREVHANRSASGVSTMAPSSGSHASSASAVTAGIGVSQSQTNNNNNNMPPLPAVAAHYLAIT